MMLMIPIGPREQDDYNFESGTVLSGNRFFIAAVRSLFIVEDFWHSKERKLLILSLLVQVWLRRVIGVPESISQSVLSSMCLLCSFFGGCFEQVSQLFNREREKEEVELKRPTELLLPLLGQDTLD